MCVDIVALVFQSLSLSLVDSGKLHEDNTPSQVFLPHDTYLQLLLFFVLPLTCGRHDKVLKASIPVGG